MKKKFDFLILDVHGVLISNGSKGENINKKERYPVPKDILRDLTDFPLDPGDITISANWIKDLKGYGITDYKKLKIFSDRWFEARKDKDYRFDRMCNVVEKLKIRKGILTNASLKLVYYHLGEKWVRGNFEIAWGWEEVRRIKPSPTCVTDMLWAANVSAEKALMIIDSKSDFVAGAEAGVRCALVGKGWGNGLHMKEIIKEHILHDYLYMVLEEPEDLLKL